ncbi:hypothetical protein NONO_c73360 [Nocardia nova SH22a]|uniref:Uncharacterized protein n=1 Tax=Nocardia nova SH22a TaxID=1415166 RepID=W5TS34_9NOCA|nr:hypothetical protein [Nocardia nova]AHH22092.1 hypothetical protein NONO_c73360 [Nocardia nova SH22a]
MHRTPEQIAADDQLTAAIEAACAAYSDAPEGVLTKYVVLTQRSYWNDDGDHVTACDRLPMNGEVPTPDVLGMIEFASTVLRHEIATE